MTDTRDVTMSVRGVQLVVTVRLANPLMQRQKPRRWAVRVAGSKEEVSEILASHVLEAIDHKISGTPIPEPTFEDEIPFGREDCLIDMGEVPEAEPRGVEALIPSDEERLQRQESWVEGGK